MERLICVLVGYVFGLIQTGYLYGKKNGVDLRKKGSGNAGTTNALRTMGWKAGGDRKSTRLNSSHITRSRMPSSA